MRILLIQPTPNRQVIGFDRMIFCEPLGLEMIAGALEGHVLRVLDLRVRDLLQERLDTLRPDLCGISCSYTIDVSSCLWIAKEIKRRNGKGPLIVVGGHHATMRPEDFFREEIDAIALGEGEEVMRDLVESYQRKRDLKEVSGLFVRTKGGFIFTGKREFIEDLDTLPFPDLQAAQEGRRYYHMGFQKPLGLIETARGCPYRCSFCSVWVFYQGRYRMKSPERVVSELARRKEKNILITDDNFLISASRAEEIARLVEQRRIDKRFTFQARSDSIVHHPDLLARWRAIGLKGVFIGFEKIKDDALDSLDKENRVENNEKALEILRALGIDVWASFIVDPDYDREDFEHLRDYIRRHQIKTPTFSILTLLPGTPLYEKNEGKLLTKDYDLFDIAHAVIPAKLPLGEFYKEYASLWSTAYSNYGLIWEGLRAFLKGDFTLSQLLRMLRSAQRLSDPSFYLVSTGAKP